MATQTTAVEAPAPGREEQPISTKEAQGDKIIRENMLWASGGGLIPVPLLDKIIAITAVEVKMLKELSALYELPFKEHQVKSILASLLAGVGAPALGAAVTASLFKSVPILGAVSGFIAIPGAAAAFTYAVGKVFSCSTSPPAVDVPGFRSEKGQGTFRSPIRRRKNWLLRRRKPRQIERLRHPQNPPESQKREITKLGFRAPLGELRAIRNLGGEEQGKGKIS